MRFRQCENRKPDCRTRITAVLVLFAMLLFLLLSTFFIAHEADHNCSGEDCPICALIQMSENNLRHIGSGVPAAAAAVSLLIFIVMTQCFAADSIITSTPVSRKTRLND